MWASTERRKLQVTDSRTGKGKGNYVQVNRLGNPLVNELIIGLPDKDKFNRTEPQDDAKNYAGYVVEPEILKALNALFNLNIKEKDRTDLVALITGLEGLNKISPKASRPTRSSSTWASRRPSRARRAASASSVATPRATRTGAGWVTTLSTSRSAWPAGSCCRRTRAARSCRWATASIRTTSRS